MAVLATTHPTMADLAKQIGPDGSAMQIAEILNQTNEVMNDAVWLPGNLTTGHRGLVRTGIPAPTWMLLNYGIPPTKSETAPIEDQCALLGAYHEVAQELADLYPNPAMYRMTEADAIIEGFGQEIAQNIFYGNEAANANKFTGFAPRFNTLSNTVPSSRNVISAGGSGSNNASIWLVGWGPLTTHMIYPKNSKAGLNHEDLGKQTSENFGGTGLRMQIYRSYFSQKVGLHVRDWRFIVRIANIDVTALTTDAATGPDLYDLMAQALAKIPTRANARFAWYTNQTIIGFLGRQARFAKNVLMSMTEMKDAAGVTTGHAVGGIPVRRVDQLLITETTIS